MSVGPLASEAGQAEERAEEKRLRLQRESDRHAIMATPEGRRFMWWLLDEVAGVDNGTFAGEALHSAYAEGRRAVGRELRTLLQAEAPASYLLMLQDELTARADRAALAEAKTPVE